LIVSRGSFSKLFCRVERFMVFAVARQNLIQLRAGLRKIRPVSKRAVETMDRGGGLAVL
jgi:hypothetical protein